MDIYKCIFCAFLFLPSNTLFAQDIGGYVASKDGEKLSYVSIYLKNKNRGVVTDEFGHYKLPSDILSEITDTLIISCIGYKSEKIPVSQFKENVLARNMNILMETDYILLQEINVKPNTEKPKEYGMFHLQSANFFLTGSPSTRILVFVENTDNVSKMIKTVNIKIRKSNDKTKKLRIFFCQKTENNFQNINVVKSEIIVSDFSKSKTKVDVSKYQIPFEENGIYVGLEWIGIENTIQDMSEKIGLSVVCTSKSNKSNTWIFSDENWIQFPSITEEELKEIPKIFWKIIRNSNAQVGITAY